MSNTAAPPAEVVAAFGGDVAALAPLKGGEGKAWRAGALVIKPETNPEVVAWLATTVEQVADGDTFRMARHIAAADGRHVVDGWAATTWLDGAHASARWDDILATSRAFHTAITGVPVPAGGIPRAGDTQWSVGDAVAWGERDAPTDTAAGVRAVIDELAAVIGGTWAGAASQVIHGDIGGNVLFADELGLPPAVIDMSPYVRPPAFADAVAVVDAIAWAGAPLTLAFRFGVNADHGEELLARAVVYRLVAASEAWREYPARIEAEVTAFRKILTAIRT